MRLKTRITNVPETLQQSHLKWSSESDERIRNYGYPRIDVYTTPRKREGRDFQCPHRSTRKLDIANSIKQALKLKRTDRFSIDFSDDYI